MEAAKRKIGRELLWRLIEQGEICSIGTTLDFEKQKELLQETISPTKALQKAFHMEMGA